MLRSKIIVFYSFIAKRIAKLLWLNVNCIVWLVNFYCILLLFLDEYSAAGSTVCTQCPAGYTCSGGTATQCNAGQYSPAGGKTELNVTLVVMPEDKIKQQNLVFTIACKFLSEKGDVHFSVNTNLFTFCSC